MQGVWVWVLRVLKSQGVCRTWVSWPVVVGNGARFGGVAFGVVGCLDLFERPREGMRGYLSRDPDPAIQLLQQ